MSFSTPVRPDILALLYGQHQNYTAELGQTHQKLSKQYKKMSKVERVLSERQDRQLSRDERKKWQYSRVLTKRNIADMEIQQATLHDMLRQCNNLIASFEHGGAANNSPMASRGGMAPGVTDLSPEQLPPSPFLFTPFSPIAFSPYTTDLHRASFGGTSSAASRPQYWDLSMLSEPQRGRRLSSPYATGSSADSGFYEPHALLHGAGLGLNEDAPTTDARGHVYSHELMSPLAPEFVFSGGGDNLVSPTTTTTTSGTTERDQVPDLVHLSAAKLGAAPGKGTKSSSHKRCYSENAIQLGNDSHLAAPNTPEAKRGTSVGAAPAGRKTNS